MIRVLLFDDHAEVLQLLRRHFDAAAGIQTLDEVRRSCPGAIVLDQHRPDITGTELIPALLATC